MSDLTLAAGVSSAASPTSVELIANNSGLLWPLKVVMAAGQNLTRGALMGRTSAGKYVLSLAAASDGSQAPTAVLVHDTAGDVEAMVYLRGDFNQAAMTFGAGQTAIALRESLRDVGIFIHKPYGVPA